MRISDWSSDVCSSDLPCGGDNFSGRKFDSARYAEFPKQRVHIAVRNNAPKQCATVGRHQAAHFRIVAEQVPDWEQAARCEKEAQIGRASCRERVCQYV